MKSSEFVEMLQANDLDFVATVPCTITTQLHELLAAHNKIRLFTTYHEHNLPGIAAGYYIATGKPAVIHMQNSGFSNALDGLLTCIKLYNIPVLILVTWRGDSSLDTSEPHQLIGSVTEEITSIPSFPVFGSKNAIHFHDDVQAALDCIRKGMPAILRISSDSFDKGQTEVISMNKAISSGRTRTLDKIHLGTREEALLYIKNKYDLKKTIFIFSNGYTARAAFTVFDTAKCFYNIGYMGGSLSIGYTLAMLQSGVNVVVIDGDQNAQMSCMKDHLFSDYPLNLNYYIINNNSGASVGNASSIPLSSYYSKLSNVIDIPVDTQAFIHPRLKVVGGFPKYLETLRSFIKKI